MTRRTLDKLSDEGKELGQRAGEALIQAASQRLADCVFRYKVPLDDPLWGLSATTAFYGGVLEGLAAAGLHPRGAIELGKAALAVMLGE